MDRLMSHTNHWTSCWPRDEKYRSILSEFSLPWTTLMLKWKGKSYWERRSWNRWRNNHQFSSVQSPSRVWFFAASWTAACQASLPIASSQFSQTHVHWVCDAFQPSHPLSSPSPPAFNLSQHQGLFKWVSSLHQVAKVLLYISNFWKKKGLFLYQSV